MGKEGATKSLVMRYSDNLSGSLDTIAEHQAVLTKLGAVWIAKVGRPLAAKKISLLNDQINRGQLTYLYLVQKQGREYQWTTAAIDEVARLLPTSAKGLIPTYYYTGLKIAAMASTWFKVSSIKKAKAGEVKGLFVVSSGKPILKTLSGSMAALFMVARASDGKHGSSTSGRPYRSQPWDTAPFDDEDDY